MTSPNNGWDAGAGTVQQPLTPDRVRRFEFSKAPLTRRGYNEDEVHFFQFRAADAIASSDTEKAKLRAEIERMKDYFREHGVVVDSEEAAARQSAPDVDAASVMMMSRAQQSADSQIAEAEDYARRIVAEARQQYQEILQQAQQQANEAAEKAQQAYRSVSGSTDGGEREQLERHIAYLRTFAEVTQVQLKSVLEGLTREIDKLEAVPVRDETTA